MSELIYKYRVASTLILLWAVVMFTWVTVQVFADVTKITGPVAAAFGTMFGLPGVGIALYKWRNNGGSE